MTLFDRIADPNALAAIKPLRRTSRVGSDEAAGDNFSAISGKHDATAGAGVTFEISDGERVEDRPSTGAQVSDEFIR